MGATELIEALGLKLGEPDMCFKNAQRAVRALPERLQYCEGFEIKKWPDGGVGFEHHAKVLDTVTGTLLEVTPDHEDVEYICETMTEDDIFMSDGDFDGPLLSLCDQLRVLRTAGYDVHLYRVKERTGTRYFTLELVDMEQLVDLDSQGIGLSYRCILQERCSGECEGDEEWFYQWRECSPKLQQMENILQQLQDGWIFLTETELQRMSGWDARGMRIPDDILEAQQYTGTTWAGLVELIQKQQAMHTQMIKDAVWVVTSTGDAPVGCGQCFTLEQHEELLKNYGQSGYVAVNQRAEVAA